MSEPTNNESGAGQEPENHYKRLLTKIWHENRPLSCNFELTYRCNLKCDFCYNVDDPVSRELTTPQILETIGKLSRLGVLYVALTGGEPMVHPDFWTIARSVKSHRMGLRLYTNGCYIDEAAADLLAGDVRALEIEISIHGSTGEVHDRLTGIRGSLDKALEGTRLLRARGVKVVLKTPITRNNQHQVWDIQKLGAELGVPVTFDPVITPRDDGDTDPLRLQATPDFLEKFWSEEWKELRGGQSVVPMDHTEIRANCGTGRTTVALDPYGNVFPCVQWRRNAGNVLEHDDLSVLWQQSEVLKEVRQLAVQVTEKTLGSCDSGEFCTFCLGVAEVQTGDPIKMYPQALVNARAKERSFDKQVEEGKARAEDKSAEVCGLTG